MRLWAWMKERPRLSTGSDAGDGHVRLELSALRFAPGANQRRVHLVAQAQQQRLFVDADPQRMHLAAGLEAVDSGNAEIEGRRGYPAQRRIDVLGLSAADLADEAEGQMHVFRIDPLRAGQPGAHGGQPESNIGRKGNANKQAEHGRSPRRRRIALEKRRHHRLPRVPLLGEAFSRSPPKQAHSSCRSAIDRATIEIGSGGRRCLPARGSVVELRMSLDPSRVFAILRGSPCRGDNRRWLSDLTRGSRCEPTL